MGINAKEKGETAPKKLNQDGVSAPKKIDGIESAIMRKKNPATPPAAVVNHFS
jgi:hypothetical protein